MLTTAINNPKVMPETEPTEATMLAVPTWIWKLLATSTMST
jgi:hypothetical protein